MDRKLAKLDMKNKRVITGLVQIPESESYYNVQIVKIENPIQGDWSENDVVKISKSIVEQIKYVK